MKLLKPRRLKTGDTIGVIAPSHPVAPFQKSYDCGIRNLREFGFEVKEGPTVRLTDHGYMAGSDCRRAQDINEMFEDDEVKGIVCAIGGQVAIRALRHVDYDLVRRNPKVFSGMSDITAYHLAFLSKAGLSSLHHSDIIFGFGTAERSDGWKYETDLFRRVTMQAEPLGRVPSHTEWEVWREGHSTGRLFGGNMTSLQTLFSTPYLKVPREDIILFFETPSKPIELIDQILVQYRETGVFDRVTGMLVGKIRGEGSDGQIVDMTAEVQRLVLEVTEESDVPIIGKMDFGHYTPNLPLPMGIEASMSTDRREFIIEESYVT